MTKNGPPADRRICWIVGASKGIGRALALALAGQGTTVIASARDADALAALVAEEAAGGRIIAEPLDMADRDAVKAAAGRIERTLGPLDLVVVSAALWRMTGLDDVSVDGIGPTFQVNVFGSLNVLEAVLPFMRERQAGHIVVLSSVAGFRGLPRAAAYGGSKAALTHICESLKFDLDRAGIRLQVVHPGFVDTPMTADNPFPMPHLISAEDAARRIVKGLASKRFEITFPRRFTWQLKALRILPYSLYFRAVKRFTGR